MVNGRSSLDKEALNRIQRLRGQVLKETKAEGLGHGRLRVIKDCVPASAGNPHGAAVGKEAASSLGELKTGMSFGTLQAAGQFKVGELH